MRTSPLWLSSLALVLACRAGPKDQAASHESAAGKAETRTETAAETRPAAVDPELGAHASSECREAMTALALLDAAAGRDAPFETKLVLDAWTGPLNPWIKQTDEALGRGDATLIDEAVSRIENLDDPGARRRELVLIVTQARTVALLEARRLLTAASDAPPATPKIERASAWDTAWCLWDGGLRPLARRADALPTRGGEDWEATIAEAFATGRAGLDDPAVAKRDRQIIEKGSYAVAYRLILADAEQADASAAAEAVGLLDMLDDRLADRNGPGLERMRAMLGGELAAIDAATIERELAVAFTKRARKYCDKAVIKAELGTPEGIAETWEGIVYTKVILPSMREALSAEGFDADAYVADWHSYLEAVERGDADTAAEISPRLVEWNCAYQDRLGIAACTSTANETQ